MTAKTVSMFVTARRMPPSAGPMNAPTASSVLEATFAAGVEKVADLQVGMTMQLEVEVSHRDVDRVPLRRAG